MLVQFIAPLKTQIQTARNPSNLDCGNHSITVGDKMTCVVADTTLFYFFGVGLAVAAGYLGFKGVKYKFAPPNK